MQVTEHNTERLRLIPMVGFRHAEDCPKYETPNESTEPPCMCETKNLGEHVLELRRERALRSISVTEAATVIGISPEQLLGLETGCCDVQKPGMAKLMIEKLAAHKKPERSNAW